MINSPIVVRHLTENLLEPSFSSLGLYFSDHTWKISNEITIKSKQGGCHEIIHHAPQHSFPVWVILNPLSLDNSQTALKNKNQVWTLSDE